MAAFAAALVLLFDRHGALLMQHRDEYAEISPNQWSLPGGRAEPGEDPARAAHRELREETGLTVAELSPFWSGPRPYEAGFPHTVTLHAFWGVTDARQDEIVLGEGKAMVFVPAARVLDRDLAISAAFVVPKFLASAQYARFASACSPSL